MSWSKQATGTPEEAGDAIRRAILDSANWIPTSPRRLRTAEAVANGTRRIIIKATEPETASARQPQIAVYSSGHINDDGSIGSCSLSISIIPQATVVIEEPAPPAPGPDSVTHAEVDAAIGQAVQCAGFAGSLTGAGAFEATADHPAGIAASSDQVGAKSLGAENDVSPLAEGPQSTTNEPTATA